MMFAASVTYTAAQPQLIRSGSIEFEKKVNRYALFKKAKMPEDWYDYYTKNNQQFHTSKSALLFSNSKTLFYPVPDHGDIDMISSNDPFPFSGQNSVVYSDLSKHSSISKKMIYGKEILIADSLPPIKWKLTDEFRDVAGYTCRRANGLMLDSVYVVAFYTNEIHFSGGPESFNGLPGMILEVFLPHHHVSWTALKVTPEKISDEKLVSPVSKAKPINRQQLKEWVAKSLKNMSTQLRELLEKGLLI